MAHGIIYPGAGFNLLSVDDSQIYPLGFIVHATDPTIGYGEFIYLKGVASTIVGSCVVYTMADFTTALAVNNTQFGFAAFAMAAIVANKYGWYQIFGKAVAKVLAGFADNALVYTSATAGSVDDTATSMTQLKGAYSASAIDTPATGYAYIETCYPTVAVA